MGLIGLLTTRICSANASQMRTHQGWVLVFDGHATRGGAVAARQAHNLKVEGSNPSPATKLADSIHHVLDCVSML